MTRLLFSILLLLGTLAPGSLFAQRPANPERDAVQQAIAQFGQNIQRGDYAALDASFPPGGMHILADSATTHGWAEYRDTYLKPELALLRDLRYEHTAIEPVVRGDVAWVAFRRVFSAGTPGSPVVQGRGTAVLEKRNGQWLIVHLHMSR